MIMNIPLFKIVLASVLFYLFTIASAQQYKRCGCRQCDHFGESIQRCECCVYFLHGKRSVDKREYHLLETTDKTNFPDEDRSQSDYSSQILDYSRDKSNVIEAFNIPSFQYLNALHGIPRESSVPEFGEIDRDNFQLEEILLRKNEASSVSSISDKPTLQLPTIVRKVLGLSERIAERKKKAKYI